MVFSSDSRENQRLGWKLRDVVGIVVLAVWAALHLADVLSDAFEVPASVDNAMLVVLGWWPVGAAADVFRAVVRTHGTAATSADAKVAADDRKRDGATEDAKANPGRDPPEQGG